MPTKYIRPSFREFAGGMRNRLYRGRGPFVDKDPNVPNTRAIIFIGLCALAVISVVSRFMDVSRPIEATPSTYGEGVVVRKEIRTTEGEEPTHVVAIEMVGTEGTADTDEVAVDAASWARLAEGEAVNVAYYRLPEGDGFRVKRIILKGREW